MIDAASSYRPTSVSPPGATLADILGEQGMTQVELAERLGRTPKMVNEVVQGKAPITAETAVQLERALGVPAQFWLARESAYREFLARQHELNELRGAIAWVRDLPWSDMVRLGWVPETAPGVQRVQQALRFFGVASVHAWKQSYEAPLGQFRISDHGKKLGAVAAWLREGERAAARVPCAAYNRDGLRARIGELRRLTVNTSFKSFAAPLVEQCAQVGVCVVFVPTPSGCPANGVTRWLTPERALVQLSFRYRTADILWFTFFHELGHLLLHPKKSLFLEDIGAKDDREREADRFAADTLIPSSHAAQLGSLSTESAVAQFASKLGIHPGIVVGRLQHDGLLSHASLNSLKVRLPPTA